MRVAKAGGGEPVRATSLTNVVALGARFGDTLLVSASGPQAHEAVAALQALADEGFGDGVTTAPPPVLTSPPTPPPTSSRAGRTYTNDDDGTGATGRTGGEPPAAGAVLTGVAASAGVAVGPAHLLRGSFAPPPERAAEDPEREQARLGEAIATARTAIERDRDAVAARAGKADAAIFNAHLVLLEDEALLEPTYRAIENGATAERAFYDAAVEVADRYRALEEPLLQERAADVLDVGRRVVEALMGEPEAGPTRLTEGIVIAGELTPADAAALDPGRVIGIATAAWHRHRARRDPRPGARPAGGGRDRRRRARHRGRNHAPARRRGGDASRSTPRRTCSATRASGASGLETRRARARERAHEIGATKDGTRIEVFANLGSAKEAANAVTLGAEGVGLLRTEFLFLDRAELPSEEEQADTLRQIATALDGRPLVVRTLDAGADKPLPALPMPPEANPFLGVRGIRLTLERPDVLATQLRAILRVAAEHPVKVMLPMVATVDEIEPPGPFWPRRAPTPASTWRSSSGSWSRFRPRR